VEYLRTHEENTKLSVKINGLIRLAQGNNRWLHI